MRIGVDFDGVISDPSLEKIYFARYYFGKRLRPEDCTTSRASKILDPDGVDKYRLMYNLIESGPASLKCRLVENCSRVLDYLVKAGHRIVIITSLDKENYPLAKEFLRRNRVPYHHLVCVPVDKSDPEGKKHPKRHVLKKLKINMMIDDSYYNLKPLSGSGARLFLMDQPWNRHIRVSRPDIIRASWHKIYQELGKVD